MQAIARFYNINSSTEPLTDDVCGMKGKRRGVPLYSWVMDGIKSVVAVGEWQPANTQ